MTLQELKDNQYKYGVKTNLIIAREDVNKKGHIIITTANLWAFESTEELEKFYNVFKEEFELDNVKLVRVVDNSIW